MRCIIATCLIVSKSSSHTQQSIKLTSLVSKCSSYMLKSAKRIAVKTQTAQGTLKLKKKQTLTH